MSAKAKPANKIRRRAVAVMFGTMGGDKGTSYRTSPGHSNEQRNHCQVTDRSDRGDLSSQAKLLDQAHTRAVNAEPPERQAA